MAQVYARLFKEEADLYSNSLSELNSRFNDLDNLKRAAEAKTHSLQEQVGALKKKINSEKEVGGVQGSGRQVLALKKRRTVLVGGILRSIRVQDNPLSGEGIPGDCCVIQRGGLSLEGVSPNFLDL